VNIETLSPARKGLGTSRSHVRSPQCYLGALGRKRKRKASSMGGEVLAEGKRDHSFISNESSYIIDAWELKAQIGDLRQVREYQGDS